MNSVYPRPVQEDRMSLSCLDPNGTQKSYLYLKKKKEIFHQIQKQ